MYERFRTDVIAALNETQCKNTSELIKAMDIVAVNYEFSIKKNENLPPTDNLPAIVETYLMCKTMAGLSSGTILNYKTVLSLFFKDINKPPEEITANEIRAWLHSYQANRKISSRTLDKYREYIARFFGWAQDEGYIIKNPAKNIEPIKHEEKPRVALTQIELEYLRLACKTPRELAIIETLYSTGCRVSELAALKKTDIDWYEKSVHLFGKGKKHRYSFLNAKAEVALKVYLENRTDTCEYLFVTERRPIKKLSKDAIEKIVRNISQRASNNIHKKVSPHILRHTTATIALHSGMPMEEISKLLGHESIETTMIYAKTSMEDVRAGHKKHIV